MIRVRAGDVATVKRNVYGGKRGSSKRPAKGRVLSVTPYHATLLFDHGVRESFALDEIIEVNPIGLEEPVLKRRRKKVARESKVDREELIRMLADEGRSVAEAADQFGMDAPNLYPHITAAIGGGQLERVGRGEYRRPASNGTESDAARAAKEARDESLPSTRENSEAATHGPAAVEKLTTEGGVAKAFEMIAALTQRVDEHERRTDERMRADAEEAFGEAEEVKHRLDQLTRHIEDRLRALEERVGYLERGQQLTADSAVPLSNHDHVARLMDMLDRLLERGAA